MRLPLKTIVARLEREKLLRLTADGYLVSSGGIPIISATRGGALVALDESGFWCPRSKLVYEPPLIIIAFASISFVGTGDIRAYLDIGALTIWIGKEPSGCATLDVWIESPGKP